MEKVTENKLRDKAGIKHLLEAFREFTEQGKSSVLCDQCEGAIEFHRLSDEVWQSSCLCGKYNEILRGI